jgi:hypothetical protein
MFQFGEVFSRSRQDTIERRPVGRRPYGLRELVGVLLISGAALGDSIWDFWEARRAAAAGAVERTRTSTVLPTSTSS